MGVPPLPFLAAAWSAALVEWATEVGLVVLVLGIALCVGRLVRGPHLADRALAVDTIAVHLVGLVILLTLRIDSLVLFDGVLVLSLLGFAGTVAVAQYIARPHLRKRRRPRSGAEVPHDPDD
ncbi:MAG TPA: monovalent cation/H+ antiporter complex subunit F [Tepidisphaeraceae bacterium]|nr:monovalent cation/H+ antiporter complex subunit F [Tepidisphaeraceae bacterium]